ncbi:hypothetical protein BCY86_00990 [Pajaroellobacter abortibovis]|uniref:Uncharacterized protein n=1 Tax=Pajaroellobacter abortibovis TaxID=1882918 RepID=A0A1L6MV79_9BACT|nr:hypothetical protein BCY86_00990 [Pajaroellobacter abortibovis]
MKGFFQQASQLPKTWSIVFHHNVGLTLAEIEGTLVARTSKVPLKMSPYSLEEHAIAIQKQKKLD